MSQQSPADPERPRHAALGPVGIDYIPTEDERRVFRECNEESFWYRSLPISATTMAFTQFLISRGALTASGRFGSLPKVAFAGFCGYLGGKMSYMKVCQEKFMSLENSPLGEALRQKQHHQPPKFTREQPGLSDPNKADFEPAFPLDDQRDSSDFTYSNPVHSADNYGTQITESSYIEEEKKKGILYKDLQSKNRENYEVTMTPKPDALLKSSADPTSYIEEEKKKGILYKDLQSKNRENYEVTMTPKPDALLKSSADPTPAKRGKKNIYGDTWEE